MKRLHTQCLVGSLAIHSLLFLLLITGAGFLAVQREPDWESLPILDFIPTKLVDAAVVGGGDPRGSVVTTPPTAPPVARAAPPAAVAPPPQPAPAKAEPPPPPRKVEKTTAATEPVRKPAPKAPPKSAAPEPDSVSETGTKKPSPKPKVEVSKTLVTRDTAALAQAQRKAAEQAEAEAAAEAARWMAQARQARTGQFGTALNRLQKDLSGRSVVAVPYGPGGGGETYAGYGLYVRLIYQRAWRAPAEAPDNSAVVTARVVIAKDGRVIDADIVTKSGVAALDRSVQAALGRVSTIGRPFPEGSPDEQKTFLIDFDLQAKRGLG